VGLLAFKYFAAKSLTLSVAKNGQNKMQFWLHRKARQYS